MIFRRHVTIIKCKLLSVQQRYNIKKGKCETTLEQNVMGGGGNKRMDKIDKKRRM